jgi:hypothetical protein
MTKSTVPFFDTALNMTSQVISETTFDCECGWKGKAADLVLSDDLSSCPKCFNLDVRMDLEDVAFKVNVLALSNFIDKKRKIS